eukprot:147636-Prymnesium_polylepis.2
MLRRWLLVASTALLHGKASAFTGTGHLLVRRPTSSPKMCLATEPKQTRPPLAATEAERRSSKKAATEAERRSSEKEPPLRDYELPYSAQVRALESDARLELILSALVLYQCGSLAVETLPDLPYERYEQFLLFDDLTSGFFAAVYAVRWYSRSL